MRQAGYGKSCANSYDLPLAACVLDCICIFFGLKKAFSIHSKHQMLLLYAWCDQIANQGNRWSAYLYGGHKRCYGLFISTLRECLQKRPNFFCVYNKCTEQYGYIVGAIGPSYSIIVCSQSLQLAGSKHNAESTGYL